MEEGRGEGEGETNMEVVSGDSSGGITTISGLNKDTAYVVEVAAENSAGIGVYSNPLRFKTPDSECFAIYKVAIYMSRCLSESQWYCDP